MAERRSFTWHGVPLTDTNWSLTTPVTRLFSRLEVHQLLGGFTQTGSPILYGLRISLRPSRHTPSIPLIRILYLWIALASALTTVISSFGVALYLYTSSATVHCFLAAILFTVRWHFSAMPFGACWIPPFVQETFKLSGAENGIVVDKDLLWGPSFVKYWL